VNYDVLVHFFHIFLVFLPRAQVEPEDRKRHDGSMEANIPAKTRLLGLFVLKNVQGPNFTKIPFVTGGLRNYQQDELILVDPQMWTYNSSHSHMNKT
jgi:hypothetical protein